MPITVSAIFVAAGQGRRFGGEVRKPFVSVDGRPLFLVTIERFAGIPEIQERILVVRAPDLEPVRARFGPALEALGVRKIVPGGERRQDSVLAAFRQCDPAHDLILVHDAVRPMIARPIIESAIRAAAIHGAALVAARVRDTLKSVDAEGRVMRTEPRSGLWRAQTPQVIARAILEKAFAEVERRGLSVTDDSEMVESIGVRPAIVAGSEMNLKITEPEDLEIVRALLALESARPKDA